LASNKNGTGKHGTVNNVPNGKVGKNGMCLISKFVISGGLGVLDLGVWANFTSMCHFTYSSICALIACAILPKSSKNYVHIFTIIHRPDIVII